MIWKLPFKSNEASAKNAIIDYWFSFCSFLQQFECRMHTATYQKKQHEQCVKLKMKKTPNSKIILNYEKKKSIVI